MAKYTLLPDNMATDTRAVENSPKNKLRPHHI